MPELERKLYQLIIGRLDGASISSQPYREKIFELVRKNIGGFIVFGGRRDEIRDFIARLQSDAENPLFIASDTERGVGQQIEGTTPFPSQMALAAAIRKDKSGDVQLLENMIKAVAAEAIDIGINMPLMPVLDVNQNPDNPIICTRAFSDTPEHVAWYGKEYIRTLEEAGLISCAKHFPGHGDTDIDSHISLPVISKPLTALMDTDIYPFKEAIASGVSSIMMGHLSIPGIDQMPASLSGKVVTDLLRKELGFEGLILTDALNMHALNEFNNVPARCVNAGVDILLHPADAGIAVEELKRGLSSGEVPLIKIDAALHRIRKYKSKINNIQKPAVDYQRDMELSTLVTEQSITLVKNSSSILPFSNVQKASLIYVGDENAFDISNLRGMIPQIINIRDLDPTKISLQGPGVFALFTSVSAWKGSSGIKARDITAIKECIKKMKQSIVIAFGSPYVLRHFMEADVLIAAYDTSRQAQASVIKCLQWGREFNGRLPVSISGR